MVVLLPVVVAATVLAAGPTASTLDRTSLAAQRASCGPVVSEPLVEPPWALVRLRPDLAWPLSRGAGVTVAVIDSGVSPDHPSLAGKVLPGLDLIGTGPGQCDENGHGTLVAGIIAARETVSDGYRFHGVAPDATILPIRVVRDQRRTVDSYLSDLIAQALIWAVDRGGADVINLSLTTVPTPGLATAVQHALDAGVVVVAASGNEGEAGGAVAYPAAYDGVIAVAGIDPQDRHVPSSSAGEHVDVAAPGVRISGPSAAGGGFLFSADGGTSFATAYVSGVAALVRAYDPTLRPSDVAWRITSTAAHPPGGWNANIGYGVVDPARAVGTLAPAGAAAPEGAAPDGAAPDGLLAAPVRPHSTDDGLGSVALWVAVAGALTTISVIVAVPVSRRGRAAGGPR
jgi:type VII secretion-associated serine protease mycosin